MMRSKTIYGPLIALFACLAFFNSFSHDAHAAFSCATGASDPPFLASGVDPNLLLLIDNSASMYDLAYVNATGNYCNDDTYDTTDNYAGYFALSTWYAYDLSGNYFKALASGSNTVCEAKGGNAVYEGIDACIAVDETTTPDTVKYFAAKGNLLNWMTASKMDVQKQVLTGGKYETQGSYGAPENALVMESRGCTNQRFVKEIPLLKGGNQYWLALAVRGPEERRFDVWRTNVNYLAGTIVTYQSDLYRVTVNHTSSQNDISNTTGLLLAPWVPYFGTRWAAGTAYTAGNIVTYQGIFYIAETNGTATGTGGPAEDTGVDWTEYHLTHIEIMAPSEDGFDGGSCQDAVEALTGDPPNLGQASQGIDDCLAYADNPSDMETNQNAAFNHSLQTCWSWIKFPDTAGDVGTGEVQRIKSACEKLYDLMLPVEISVFDDPGYVCYGWYNNVAKTGGGYLGACWDPGGELKCTREKKDGTCLKWEYVEGGAAAGWIGDDCIATQLAKYCSDISVPEVVDPSDEVSQTGEFFNLPAVLVDSGLGTQMGTPLLVMKGYIGQSAAPVGLLHEFADDIRIGAMKFNNKGSYSECDQPSPFIDYACDITDDQDGSQLVYPIGKNGETAGHTTGLVANINDIVADSWTPIAEALFSATGYFTRVADFSLNSDDLSFPDGTSTKASDPPCTNWCQNNNILIITEGASTTDLNEKVADFALANGDAVDTDAATSCDTLYGSTFLDDLTWYAQHGSNIFNESDYNAEEHFQNIKTFIVVAGTPRTEGIGECSPLTLLTNAAYNGGTFAPFVANDPYELQENLKTVFNLIRAGAAAGSAASVISATRGGEGAIYQAIFWPTVDGPTDKPEVAWTGEVHALLIDAYGNLYEDTNGDNALTYDTDGAITDDKVVLYYDVDNKISKACFGSLNADGTCNGTSKGLHEVKYLWSAAEWLADVLDTTTNRITYLSSTEKRRYIFTWNDLDNDGVVDTASGVNEIIPFTVATNWAGLSVNTSTRAPVPLDFGVKTEAEVDKIVRWIRGQDDLADTTLRPREVPTPANFSLSTAPATITWRLGDVVHSTPTSVSRPAEGYHFLYKDYSYAQFLNVKRNRRNVIYFGGNDGMVHAINGGFYDEQTKKFWRGMTEDAYYRPTFSSNGPALGAELWAYVPYNLLPHLKCLTQPSYSHKYFVDLKPRVFDVRLWKSEWNSNAGKHPYGWGTIMVIGMRFGGSPVSALDLADDLGSAATYAYDKRHFKSAYIILDITDPETPPVLMAEMTYADGNADMAYTASVPSVAPMRSGDNDYEWQLVLGSGPTDIPGRSTQNAKIAVVQLSSLVGGTPFRIPTTAPTATQPGSWELAEAANGFVADSVAVDYQLLENYKADVIYFGTVEGTWDDGNDATTTDGWGGRMYRLVTNEDTPDGWTDPNDTLMFDAGRPITAAPSIGSDGKNFWVYFGTGRFFDKKDKTDASSNDQEAFFGLKEPMDENKDIIWTEEILKANLWRTDQILVESAGSASSSDLSCRTADECRPTGVTRFDQLEKYILNQTDGWYLAFDLSRERNLGQGALLGGLMTFTTYQPFDDVCKPEGFSFLYGVYYITGTGYYEPVFTTHAGGGTEGDNPKVVTTKLSIGRGLATTPNLHVGRQEGSKAFVQTSTGTIVEIPQPNLPIKTTKSGRMSWRSE